MARGRAPRSSYCSAPETAATLPAQIQVRRARLFARYGRGEDAGRALQAAEEAMAGYESIDRCLTLALAGDEVEELLSAAMGNPAAPAPGPARIMACLEPEPETR